MIEPSDCLVEFLRTLPEQQMASVVEEHSFSIWYMIANVSALRRRRCSAVSADKHQRRDFNLGEEYPPIEIEDITHEFDFRRLRTFQHLVHEP